MAAEFELYWVTDTEHSENWFIFARGEREAREYHRDYEGFGTVKAHLQVFRSECGDRELVLDQPEGDR